MPVPHRWAQRLVVREDPAGPDDLAEVREQRRDVAGEWGEARLLIPELDVDLSDRAVLDWAYGYPPGISTGRRARPLGSS